MTKEDDNDYEERNEESDESDESEYDEKDDDDEDNNSIISTDSIDDHRTTLHDNDYLTGSDRKSKPIMTDFEAVRIIGERKKQLILGAKPMIKTSKKISYEKLAVEEFINNAIPFKLIRPLPNGKHELWELHELSKDYLKIF